jgi:hypothetical protein
MTFQGSGILSWLRPCLPLSGFFIVAAYSHAATLTVGPGAVDYSPVILNRPIQTTSWSGLP